LQDVGAGFGSDTNKVTIIAKDGSSNELPLMSKKETATAIIQTITNLH
jgi:phosphopantothenoylcysteine decarboxylase/phosphopantothenate--cysteine ligase